MSKAVAAAGYRLGKDIFFALDVASSEFYNRNGTYTFKKSTGKTLTGAQLVEFYAKLCKAYPIVSIEDGCAEATGSTGSCSRETRRPGPTRW
jgi:enolase